MPKNYLIAWSAPSSNGGSAITGYDVGVTEVGVYGETVYEQATTGTSYTVTGLTDGTEYSVRVRAENGVGKGPWSDAVTQVAALAPEQVTGLSASGGDTTLDLSWTAPASDATITDYSVEYTPSGGSATTVLVGSAATSYQITGLTNDTEYSVRVAAVSAAGTGAYSTAVTGTPSAALFTFDDPTPSFSGTFTSLAYNNGPTHGRGSNAFFGGVLTPSGKVVLVPFDSANVGIYDPDANTYTNGPSHGRGGSAFTGGVLTPSGKVVLVPDGSANIGIYDPDANTYTNGPAHGRGGIAFRGGVLTPSGKVVLVPYNSANVGIYDPVANTYILAAASGSQFYGGVLTPSGKVVLVPFGSANVGIYDPVADAYTNGPAHGRGGFALSGGVLTPSGKVVLVPYNSTTVGIYDPVANTYTNGPTHGRGSGAFYGGVLTPSGKVVLVPFRSANVGIMTPDPLLPVSASTAMSPYLNKL